MGSFSKNDQQDLTRREQPRPRGEGGEAGVRDNLPLLFDADANGLYRIPLRCL